MSLRFGDPAGTSLFPETMLEYGAPASLANVFAGGGTIMGWVRVRTFGEGPDGGAGFIVSKSIGTGLISLTNVGWNFYAEALGGRFIFVHGSDLTSSGFWGSPSPTVVLNTWYHVAVTHSTDAPGNVPSIYVNGVSQTITTFAQPPVGSNPNDDTAMRLSFGDLQTGSRGMNGFLRDWRIYDSIKTAQQIAHINNSLGIDFDLVDDLLLWAPMNDESHGRDKDGVSAISVQSVTNVLNATADRPTESQIGDTWLVAIASTGADAAPGVSETFTTPTGWTLVGTEEAPSSTSRPSLHVYRRVAEVGDPATLTIVGDQVCNKISCWMSFRGKNFPAAEDVVATGVGTSAAPVCPTISPSGDGIGVFLAVSNGNVVRAGGNILNFPELVNGRLGSITNDLGHDGCGLTIATQMISAGASGTRTHSLTASSTWAAMSIGFEPFGSGLDPSGQGVSKGRAEKLANRQVNNPFTGNGNLVVYDEQNPPIRTRRRV